MSEFINLKQAAEKLNVTRATMYKLVRDRKLRAFKPGGRLQFKVVDVDQYISQTCTMPETINAEPVTSGTND